MKNFSAFAMLLFIYCFSIAEVRGNGNSKEVASGRYKTMMKPVSWDLGTIYLVDGKTIRGKVFYSFEKGVVLVESQGKILTFTAETLSRFIVYDHLVSAQRTFVSFNPENHPSKQRVIFEIVMQGKLSLLRLQKISSRCEGYFNEDIQQFVGYTSGFTYYFLYDNKIQQLRNFKRQYTKIAGESMEDIENYILNNKLKFTRIHHQVKLIQYFNNIQ
jgi:hypothetical protein